MFRLVKVILVLMALVVIISGTAVADDGQPHAQSAWDTILADPPLSDWVATLRQTIDTSAFDPPLIDAVGLAYLPASDNLLIADSEVEETELYEDVNLYEVTREGVPAWTGTTVPRTHEPVGLTVNPFNNHLFLVSDSEQRIFEVAPGPDGRYFTGDDISSVFSTNPRPDDPDDLDALDAEGVAYNSSKGTLYIIEDKPTIEGVRQPSVLIELDPGPNGVFDGVAPQGDDTTTHVTLDDLDPDDTVDPVAIYGAEDIAFNHNSGTLYVSDTRPRYILEITTEGEWVRRIDIVDVPAVRTDGLAYAPSSTDPGAFSLYIADRGEDEINDGKVYEISLPGPTPGNDPPEVTAGNDEAITAPGSTQLDGNVEDDGNPGVLPLVQYWNVASGPGPVDFADDSAAKTTATFTAPGTYVLRLTASDGELSAFDEVTITVELDPDALSAQSFLPFVSR